MHLASSTLSAISSHFFFFYCYGHHRDLHSFPTRRSSDLAFFVTLIFPKAAPGLPAEAIGFREKDGSRGLASLGVLFLASIVFGDRKSTRLNSSHSSISYAVFCLKKKKKTKLLHFYIVYLQ